MTTPCIITVAITGSLPRAALVKQVVDLCDEYERRPATVAEARALLSLPQSTPPGH